MPRKRKPRQQTLLEVACRNVGWRLAAAAFVHAFQWAVVREALGRDDFTMDELAEWWGMSRAQVFREQSTFRRALGHMCHGSQSEFWEFLDAQDSAPRERVRKAYKTLQKFEASQRESRESWSEVAASLGVVGIG